MASIDIFNRKASVPDWMAKWWEFDQTFSAKVMAGDWGSMTRKEHEYSLLQVATNLFIATAIGACAAIGRDQKIPELPPTGQATIGLITESIAGSDPQLTAQLNLVKTLSGNLNCVPQIIAVDAGDGINTESVGVCKIKTDGSEESILVTIRSNDSTQAIINENLLAYPQRDHDGKVIAFLIAYNKSEAVDGISEVMWVYKNGGGEYVFTNGTRLELDKPETEMAGFSFEKLLGNLLDPGNVAQAAEATQVYDPTKPATVTATPTNTATDVPKPTETPTPTATATKELVAPTPIPATPTPPEAQPTPDPRIPDYLRSYNPVYVNDHLIFFNRGGVIDNGEYMAGYIYAEDCKINNCPLIGGPFNNVNDAIQAAKNYGGVNFRYHYTVDPNFNDPDSRNVLHLDSIRVQIIP